VKFFLDRNIPYGLLQVFTEAGLEAVHHDDLFAPTTQDPFLIEYVARLDLVLVTLDQQMRKAHRAALRSHTPRVIFLAASLGHLKASEQAEWFRTTWLSACRRMGEIEPGVHKGVDKSGAVKEFWRPAGEETPEEGDGPGEGPA